MLERWFSPIVNINGMYPHVWVICTLYNSAHSKQALSQTIPIGELGMRIKGLRGVDRVVFSDACRTLTLQ